MDVSEQAFVQLAQASNTQRGMVLPAELGGWRADGTCVALCVLGVGGWVGRAWASRLLTPCRCSLHTRQQPTNHQPPTPGRHLFDATMFRLVWGPAVNAMCSIVDNVSVEPLVSTALDGLQVTGSHALAGAAGAAAAVGWLVVGLPPS